MCSTSTAANTIVCVAHRRHQAGSSVPRVLVENGAAIESDLVALDQFKSPRGARRLIEIEPKILNLVVSGASDADVRELYCDNAMRIYRRPE